MQNTRMIDFKKGLAGDLSGIKAGLFPTQKRREKAFALVFDEADKAFGIADNYREYLAKKVLACKLYAQAVQGKRWLYTQARVRDAEADAVLYSGGKDEQFELVCARLTKKIGVRVDSATVTVADFYSYLLV